MRCGHVRPGANGPWSDICVGTECDGSYHQFISIEGNPA